MKWFKRWLKEWQCRRMLIKMNKFNDDYLTVCQLKWIIKEFDLKDNAKVYVERVEDRNMFIIEKGVPGEPNDKMEYMRLWGYTKYKDDGNLYLMVHY